MFSVNSIRASVFFQIYRFIYTLVIVDSVRRKREKIARRVKFFHIIYAKCYNSVE